MSVAASPELVLNWLADVEARDRTEVRDPNFLGLASISRGIACPPVQGLPQGVALQWAEVTLRALRLACAQGAISETRLVDDEISLRCALIDEMGAAPHHAWLDVDIPVSLFLDALGVPLERADARTDRWRDLPREEILALRTIKNHLGSLGLVRDQLVSSDSEDCKQVLRWLALRPRLP